MSAETFRSALEQVDLRAGESATGMKCLGPTCRVCAFVKNLPQADFLQRFMIEGDQAACRTPPTSDRVHASWTSFERKSAVGPTTQSFFRRPRKAPSPAWASVLSANLCSSLGRVYSGWSVAHLHKLGGGRAKRLHRAFIESCSLPN